MAASANESAMKNLLFEGEQIKPLTDSDVDNEMKRIGSLPVSKQNQVAKIIQGYSNTISAVINMSKTKVDTDLKTSTNRTDIEDLEEIVVNLEQLTRILNLCPLEEKFIRTKDKVFAARQYILNKDADHFLNKDYSAIVKKDHNQAFIERMMEIVQESYRRFTPEELERYWIKAAELLRYVALYRKITES